MKTKDLIEILTQYDPTGEKEVLVVNNDIDYIVKEPMYQDECGYIITKRENYKQPTEVTLKTTGEKINLIPINAFDYYQRKILQDQQFIKLQTEENIFYWETPKLVFNKLLSLFYCKEYLKGSDEKLYPYKNSLMLNIMDNISNLIISYQSDYFEYCKRIKCSKVTKELLFEIINKIFSINNNIILSLPLVDKEDSIILKTVGVKNFKIEIIDTIINVNYKSIYDNNTDYIKYTNINLQDNNLFKIFNSWNSAFSQKIENMLFC